jgi:hypothetical protein
MHLSIIQNTQKYIRRCPFLKEKKEFKNLIRSSAIIFQDVRKEPSEYLFKGLEVFLSSELLMVPFLQNKEEQFLLNELIVFLFEKNQISQLRNKKYQIQIISKVVVVFVKRVIFPLIMKDIFCILNTNVLHFTSN